MAGPDKSRVSTGSDRHRAVLDSYRDRRSIRTGSTEIATELPARDYCADICGFLFHSTGVFASPSSAPAFSGGIQAEALVRQEPERLDCRGPYH